jgi:hypothetical protein
MEVAKEEVIVIICMLNHFQIHSRKICLHKCIYNILNIDKKKEVTVKIQILNGLEEIEEKSEDKNNLTKDKGQDQKIERNKKKEEALLLDHFLKIEGI